MLYLENLIPPLPPPIRFSSQLYKHSLVDVGVIKEGVTHCMTSLTEASVEYVCQLLTEAGPEINMTDPHMVSVNVIIQ